MSRVIGITYKYIFSTEKPSVYSGVGVCFGGLSCGLQGPAMGVTVRPHGTSAVTQALGCVDQALIPTQPLE